MMHDKLEQGKGMEIKRQNSGVSDQFSICFKTQQTLAPNYNESIQIEDYLYAI